MIQLFRSLVLRVISLVLMGWLILCSASLPATAQALSNAQVAPLIEKLVHRDARVRHNAADELVALGSVAVPDLIAALNSPDKDLRWRAASVLGDLGAEAEPAVPALIQALQDEDSQIRLFATLALGSIGPAARSALPTLIATLNDPDLYVRIYAPTALRKIGIEAKIAVPALIGALKDSNARVRLNAAAALGEMGLQAAPAIPYLIKTLADEQSYVRIGAVKGLERIAEAFQDQAPRLPRSQLNQTINMMSQALQLLQDHPDFFGEEEMARLRRPLMALQAEKKSRLFDNAWEWLWHHPWLLATGCYGIWVPSLAWLLLRLAPLWILRVNDALKPYTDFSLPIIGIRVPLRFVLFIGWFHYHPHVLDAWVNRYLATARENFARKDTVRARANALPLPVVLEGTTIPQLHAQILRPIFAKPRFCLVIWGEGGAGKTSLACQIATWAMAESADHRLWDHPMLPVLLEDDLKPMENTSAFLEAIRGQLQNLIDAPEPICPDLLLRLLRLRRILVIVDHLSEMTATTRDLIQPESPDFAVNALVITSRLEEPLGRVNKTTLKPMRIESNRLASFMEAYLAQRCQRDRLTDQEFFQVCNQLSLIVGPRNITVLLAKLYAEQVIAALEDAQVGSLPANIPDLMLGYLNELNRDVTVDRLPDQIVHQAAKIIAWQCLRQTFQSTAAKRVEVVAALADADMTEVEALLNYLETSLHLIQTMGPARDRLRFAVDPLAEYCAALHLVERYQDQPGAWQTYLDQAQQGIQAGQQQVIQGFLLAVRDCYLSEIATAQPSDPVPKRLAELGGIDIPTVSPQSLSIS